MPTEENIDHGPLTPGNSLQKYNALVDAILAFQSTVYDRFEEGVEQVDGPPGARLDIFFGLTTESPPSGSSAYTDARYYVKRAIAADPSQNPTYSSDGSMTDAITAAADLFNTYLPLASTITATNLAELPSNYQDGEQGAGKGTHSLMEKTLVLVVGFPSRSEPMHRTYCFIQPSNSGVCVKITGHASGGGKYNGTIMSGTPQPSTGGNLAMPESYTNGSTCLIINVEETGAGSFWRIATGSYAVGIIAGTVSGDPNTPVVVIRGALGDLTSPLSLPPGGISPNSTDWDWTTTGSAFTVDLVSDVWWDTSAGTLNKNYRTMTFDARGMCRHVTAETTTAVDTAVDCSS